MMCGCGRETSVHTMGTCEGEDMKVARLDARRKVEGVIRKHLGHTALVGCIDATCDMPYTKLLNWFIPTKEDETAWSKIYKHTVNGAMDAVADEVRGADTIRQLIVAVNKYPRALGAQGYIPQAMHDLTRKLMDDSIRLNADTPVCLKLLKRQGRDACECKGCTVAAATKRSMMAVQRALLDGRADIWATRQSIVPDLMVASGLAAKMATATGGRTDGKQSGPKATDRQLRVVPITRAEDRLRYLTMLSVREMTGRGHRTWQRVQNAIPVLTYAWSTGIS